MKYVDVRKIELYEVDVGDPGPGEVQIAVRACGLCAWDLATFKSGPQGRAPAPPGHEGVGVVRKVGQGVEGFKEGDIVAGGGFCSLQNVRAVGVVKLPADIPPEELPYWILEPVGCVVNGVDHVGVRPGDRVVLTGAGYMGLLMVQLLAHCPAGQVTAVDVVDERLELASRLGADRVLRADQPGIADVLKEAGVDTVVDTSGSQAACDLGLQIVPRGGKFVLFGWHRGTLRMDGTDLHLRGATLISASPAATTLPDIGNRTARLMARGMVSNKPLVTHIMPLERLEELLSIGADKADGYIKGVATLPEV